MSAIDEPDPPLGTAAVVPPWRASCRGAVERVWKATLRWLRRPTGVGHLIAAFRSGLLRSTASMASGLFIRASLLATWHDHIGSIRPLRWRGRWILAAPLWEPWRRDLSGLRPQLLRMSDYSGAGALLPPPVTPHGSAWEPPARNGHPRSHTPSRRPAGTSVRTAPRRCTTGHGGVERDFPIDIVYTWVDGDDPAWRERCWATLAVNDEHGLDPQAANPARFRNRDELRYSLRSLSRFAPFARHVYIVTDGQVPGWLDVTAPNVTIVPHDRILEPDCLPTFNSHAIETALHRVEGLAEHYLYLNDDFFFGRPCQPSTFFTRDGRTKLFPDPRAIVPAGSSGPTDRPVDSASKNTRELIRDEFDLLIEHKMQHVPYPQRRSVLREMEVAFPRIFKQTARNPFRHHTDVNIASCFSHYYGFSTGSAVPGYIDAAYVNIGNPWAPMQMRRLLRQRDRDVFCLNEGLVSVKRPAIVDATVRSFLEAYFPEPSPYELTDRVARSSPCR